MGRHASKMTSASEEPLGRHSGRLGGLTAEEHLEGEIGARQRRAQTVYDALQRLRVFTTAGAAKLLWGRVRELNPARKRTGRYWLSSGARFIGQRGGGSEKAR